MKFKSLFLFSLLGFFSFGQSIQFENLDAILDSIEVNKSMSIVVSVDENGKNIYQRAVGNASYNPEKKNEVDTRFKIGSITKTYTASLIMLLEEEGKLSLDDKLSEYFPDINGAHEITLKQMLQHRSGLANYTDDESFSENLDKKYAHDQLISLFKDKPLEFSPGEKFKYSNSNYLLLGYIIENIEGKSFAEVLEEKIVVPNKLLKTNLLDRDSLNLAKSYNYGIEVPQWKVEWSAAAGGIVSNTQEVNRFYYLLMNDSIVSKESLQKMLDFKDEYGFGLMSAPFYQHKIYMHTGGIEAFSSLAAYVPEKNINFTILNNENNNANIVNNDIGIALLSDVYGVDYKMPSLESSPSVEINVSEFEKWTGNYSNEQFPLDIKVFINDDRIFAQATGQGAFPLSCINKDEAIFQFSLADITMQFEENEEQQIMNFKQGATKLVFTKGK